MLTTFKTSDGKPPLRIVRDEPVYAFTREEAAALRERGQRFETIAERQHDVIYALERSGILALANQADRDAAHRVLADYQIRSEMSHG